MNFDAKQITLNEMIDIEIEVGKPFDEMTKFEAARVLVWILKRRDDPSLTLADAGRLTTIGDIEAMGITAAEESPGEAPGGGNGLSPPVSPGPGLLTPSP